MRRLEREYARTDRGKRAVRFGLLTAALTLLGHTLAGGVPAPSILLVALGFTAWHRISLGRTRLSWPQLLGLAALAQGAAHVVLWVGGDGHASHSAAPATHAAHAAHATTDASTQAAGSVLGGIAQAMPAGGMLAVHLGLALVMAVAVRRSEARLIARLWFELLLARMLPVLGAPLVHVHTAPAAPWVEVRGHGRVLVHSVGRRGPPAIGARLAVTPIPAQLASG